VPDCTYSQWIDMYNQILEDAAETPVDALSVSYGAYEGAINYYGLQNYFTEATELAELLAGGTTIFAASGDRGSFFAYPWDLDIHADVSYPASDPSVLSVGGTTLLSSGAGTTDVVKLAEYAWSGGGVSGSGGGISSQFTAPSWQRIGLGLTRADPKQIPDLANIADPYTGATVALNSETGSETGAVGGTSAASPTTAGILALLNQKAGTAAPLKNVGKWIYAHTFDFNDITQGANGFYKAKKGYDNVTGIGTPDVGKLLGDL
jgi:kumamolisin